MQSIQSVGKYLLKTDVLIMFYPVSKFWEF